MSFENLTDIGDMYAPPQAAPQLICRQEPTCALHSRPRKAKKNPVKHKEGFLFLSKVPSSQYNIFLSKLFLAARPNTKRKETLLDKIRFEWRRA